MKKIFRSFTLIEILIVIALLGALAAALLATLDPFEQFKKGTDTGTINTASNLHKSIVNYYAIKNHMPWCSNAQTCTNPSETPASSLTTMINRIVSVGELKNDFVNLAGGQLDNIYVTGTNDPPVVSVCYKPISKSFIFNENTKYAKSGLNNNNCPPSQQNNNNIQNHNCFYCIK